MVSSKKISIPISSLSSEQIYALLDDIEEIDNLMNDSDICNGSNFIPTAKSSEAVVKIAKLDSESEDDGGDVPLRNLLPKRDVVWKWNKYFEKPVLKKCSLAE